MFGQGLVTFNPKNFSGLKLWLDAANPSNNGTWPTPNATLSTWVDLSGVTGNAINIDGSPLFQINIQNGLPGVQFNGTNTSYGVSSLAIGSNLSLFTVSTSSAQNLFMEQSVDTNSHDGFYIFGAGGDAISITNEATAVQAADSNWSGTSCVLLSETYDGTTIRGYKNGTQVVSQAGSISNTTITDTLYIGSRGAASLFMTGYIHEIILYSGLLTAGQQALVNDYLRRKWSIY